jgi:hypothetical protein
MKPMIIIPPNTMSDADIQELRKNEICVVVATDPAKVKFVDPIPAVSSRTKIEQAAIQLSRKLLHRQWTHITTDNSIGINTISRLYIECLIAGTPLDERGSIEEREQEYFDNAKMTELERLAKEEARAERAAKRAAANPKVKS